MQSFFNKDNAPGTDIPSVTAHAPVTTYIPALPSTSASSAGINWRLVVVFILLLALIGINVFTYAAEGTSFITDHVVRPILKLTGYVTLQSTKTTVNNVDKGVDVVAKDVSSAIDTTLGLAGSNAATGAAAAAAASPTTSATTTAPVAPTTATTTAPTTAQIPHMTMMRGGHDEDSDDEAVPNSPRTQTGYCYVGSEKGKNVCAYVGVNDACQSGKIYPTKEMCVNPHLRSKHATTAQPTFR